MATFWRKGNKIIAWDGKFVRSDECPCGMKCDCRAKSKKLELMGREPARYELVAEIPSNYSCAIFRHENEDWVPFRTASGTLVQVLPRNGDSESRQLSTDARYFVNAITLHDVVEEKYITFGCECTVGNEPVVVDDESLPETTDSTEYGSYCIMDFKVIEGYCISGVVDLQEHSIGEYEPLHSCEPDLCDASETMLRAFQSWHGGDLVEEGFVVDEVTDDSSPVPRFIPFRLLWKFTDDGGNGRYMIVGCDCQVSGLDFVVDENGDKYPALESAGICESECRARLYLRGWASYREYDYFDEGVLVQKCPHCDSVYNYQTASAYLAYAKSETHVFLVKCDCDGLRDEDAIQTMDVSLVPSQYKYLEYDGACTCIDSRELLREYPDILGVESVSFGNETKYSYDSYCVEENGSFESRQVDGGGLAYGICNNGMPGYIDYRVFCWIQKVADPDIYQVCWISPPDSSVSSKEPSFDEISGSPCGNVAFAGHAVPFTHDADLDMDFAGNCILWSATMEDYSVIDYLCFSNQENADEHYDWHSEDGKGIWLIGGSRYGLVDVTPVNSVSTALAFVPGIRETRVIDGETMYCVLPPYCKMGVPSYQVEWETQYGDMLTSDVYLMYFRQWIDTNKGILCNGEEGYQQTLPIRGIQDFVDSVNPPDWESYGHGEYDGQIFYLQDETDVNKHDTWIQASHVDDDMHGCHDDWLDDDEGEEEE